jgi:hypothetical protein
MMSEGTGHNLKRNPCLDHPDLVCEPSASKAAGENGEAQERLLLPNDRRKAGF